MVMAIVLVVVFVMVLVLGLMLEHLSHCLYLGLEVYSIGYA